MVDRIGDVEAEGAHPPAEYAADVGDQVIEAFVVDQVSDHGEAVTTELGERHSESPG